MRISDWSSDVCSSDLQIDTNPYPTDFAREGVDLAVRYGVGGYPGLFECRLFSERYFPVRAPYLLPGAEKLAEPAVLPRHTLLHDRLEAHTSELQPLMPNSYAGLRF